MHTAAEGEPTGSCHRSSSNASSATSNILRYTLDKMAFIADIPKYAFGTSHEIGTTNGSEISQQDFKEMLLRAIELGCRHIDCAPLYGTQPLVGQVICRAIEQKLVSRNELFITSKLSVNMMRDEHVSACLQSSLNQLQIKYLDLFLIHAPFATKHVKDDEVYPLDADGNLLMDEDESLLESTWRKLVDLKQKGQVRYIGLSNVSTKQLERLNSIYHVDVVQNEYHLYNQDREFFDYCEELDIHYEAYAAFGCPPRAKQLQNATYLSDPVVGRIAQANNITHAQVIIQWLHHQPLSYVIKTDNVSQLEENLKAATNHKMTISINDMIDLDGLNRNLRLYLYDQHKGLTEHLEYPFNGGSSKSKKSSSQKENNNNNNQKVVVSHVVKDNKDN